jgi:hypothetical protein
MQIYDTHGHLSTINLNYYGLSLIRSQTFCKLYNFLENLGTCSISPFKICLLLVYDDDSFYKTLLTFKEVVPGVP